MTREEALAKLRKAYTDAFGGFDIRTPNNLVVGLEALGLLQLDQPKSAEQRAIEVLESIRSPIKHSDLPAILSSVGLKIVEK